MSIKKLQDLLNAGPQGGREQPKLISQVNRSPSVAQAQYSPLGNGASRSPSYHSIPGVQQMFYHPSIKPQVDPVCPSPMFQVPAKKNGQSFNSMLQGSRFTAAETNPTNNVSNLDTNNVSNSVHSLLNQLQNQMGNQPRNLEELLQKSFSSVPQNSLPQSPFVSSVQSPFVGGNNYSSQVQQSMGSEMSNLFAPLTLLETSLQSSNLLNNQVNKNQSSETVNKALVLQLAQILKQESESKIKSAIAELILKYKALGLLNNLSGNEMIDLQGLIKGAEAPHNNPYQQYQQPQEIPQQIPQHIPQQNLVSLSCGIPMNAIPRNNYTHPTAQPMSNMRNEFHDQRVHVTRRELFAMDEAPARHQVMEVHSQNLPQNVHLQLHQTSFLSGATRGVPVSPVSNISNLNHEMNSLTLNNSMNQTHMNNFSLSTLSAPEKMIDFSTMDLGTLLKHKVPSEEEIPGVYNKYERINKILKYKGKIRKWRVSHPVRRGFKGRSQVAGQKPRIKGKFVTIEEYQQHVVGACKNEFYDSVKEEDF